VASPARAFPARAAARATERKRTRRCIDDSHFVRDPRHEPASCGAAANQQPGCRPVRATKLRDCNAMRNVRSDAEGRAWVTFPRRTGSGRETPQGRGSHVAAFLEVSRRPPARRVASFAARRHTRAMRSPRSLSAPTPDSQHHARPRGLPVATHLEFDAISPVQ
jgi:hypothetical protein